MKKYQITIKIKNGYIIQQVNANSLNNAWTRYIKTDIPIKRKADNGKYYLGDFIDNNWLQINEI